MEKLLNQQELEQEILALQGKASAFPDQSIRASDVRSASPYVLALIGALKVVLAQQGDRLIKIGGISVSVNDLLNAMTGALTGITQ